MSVAILSRVLEPTFQEVFGALMPDLGQNIAKKIKKLRSVVNFEWKIRKFRKIFYNILYFGVKWTPILNVKTWPPCAQTHL